jgi:hypothetical protein
MTAKKETAPAAGKSSQAVTLQVNEDAGTHSIGATIDGVFVPFAELSSTYVDTIVASGKLAQEAAKAETAAAA